MAIELDTQLNVRVSEETKDKLETLASANGLKPSDLARIAVEQLLRQNKIELIIPPKLEVAGA
jgi:predicted transcriptional regulator